MVPLNTVILFFIHNPIIYTPSCPHCVGQNTEEKQEDCEEVQSGEKRDEVGREIGDREETAEGEKMKQWEEKKDDKGKIKMVEENGRRRWKNRRGKTRWSRRGRGEEEKMGGKEGEELFYLMKLPEDDPKYGPKYVAVIK
jgi:hypothetical protein